MPDATTILKFRGLLNDNKHGEKLFSKVGEALQSSGFKLETGTIVDRHHHRGSEFDQEQGSHARTQTQVRP